MNRADVLPCPSARGEAERAAPPRSLRRYSSASAIGSPQSVGHSDRQPAGVLNHRLANSFVSLDDNEESVVGSWRGDVASTGVPALTS